MFVKIHKSCRTVVAICDSDILGKKFEEGKRQLEVRESFYKGTEVSKPELLQIIKRQLVEDASFNIVGKESVQTAIEAGIITKEGVAKVKNIPFALTLL
jgi:hypothetical protein